MVLRSSLAASQTSSVVCTSLASGSDDRRCAKTHLISDAIPEEKLLPLGHFRRCYFSQFHQHMQASERSSSLGVELFPVRAVSTGLPL